MIVRRAGLRRKQEGNREWLYYSDTGGLTHYGAYVDTLQPGARSSDPHWHEKEDEFIYVLAGEVTVIEDAACIGDSFPGFVETMRALGLLENTVLMVTNDHGHNIGDRQFLGKRGYPSGRAVFDVPLLIRHPQGQGAGKRSDVFLQHTDMAAQILEFAGAAPQKPMDGRAFWGSALNAGDGDRDHVTVAWGSAITVIDSGWWFNAKIDGSGPFLYDLAADPELTRNVADEHPDECKRLFGLGVADAEGGFPDYLMDICKRQADAPGCSRGQDANAGAHARNSNTA